MTTRYVLRRTDHTILCNGEGMLASQAVEHLNSMAQQITALQVAHAKLISAAREAHTLLWHYDLSEQPNGVRWDTPDKLKQEMIAHLEAAFGEAS